MRQNSFAFLYFAVANKKKHAEPLAPSSLLKVILNKHGALVVSNVININMLLQRANAAQIVRYGCGILCNLARDSLSSYVVQGGGLEAVIQVLHTHTHTYLISARTRSVPTSYRVEGSKL